MTAHAIPPWNSQRSHSTPPDLSILNHQSHLSILSSFQELRPGARLLREDLVNGGQCVKDIRAAVAALNRGEPDEYLRHFGPTSMRWVDGIEEPFSLTEVRENLGQLLSAFEGLYLSEELLFGTDRYACAHWRMTGRHIAEYLGIPPTGRTIDVRTCEVYEFEAGRVCSTWTHGDMTTLFNQIDGSLSPGRLR
jgi:predicted ester cyclase